MPDVLITGLGIGKDFGVCDVNNMNYRELLLNPHVLLWAERVCLPQRDYFSDDVLGKEYKLVFEILEQYHIIRRYDIEDINSDGLFNDFLGQAVAELDALEKKDPNNVKPGDREHVPYETNIGDCHYCAPKIAALNATRFVASEIEAYCLLDTADEYYIQKRLSMLQQATVFQGAVQMNNIYKELFSVKLPNESILHEYGIYKGCSSCVKNQQCKDTYLIDVERKLLSFLTIRNYDEMRQLRSQINEIVLKSKSLSLTNKEANEYILREIDKKQLIIRNNINNLFPRVKRFANMVTTVSIPFAIGNAAVNNPCTAIACSVLSGISLLSSSVIDSYSSKQNWVNFIDRNNNRC